MSWVRPLVEKARRRLVEADDTVCLQRAELVTEAYRVYEAEPPPLRRAKAFAHVLANMDLDVAANPVFAGNTSSRLRAWMLLPEYGFQQPEQVLIEHSHLRGLLDRAIPKRMREFWQHRAVGGSGGPGHLAVDMHAVVHRGLLSLAEEAERLAARADGERAVFRRAMAIALRAVIDWASRFARAASAAARRATDPAERCALTRVAEACRRVPALPARNLFEGLQAMVLVHLAVAIEGHSMSVSIGLPDRVLEPLVGGEDFDADEATDLAAAFMLKVAANSVFGRGSKTQAITVGGCDLGGSDRCNALTRCFIEAADIARVGDPHLFLRWHPGIDPQVERRAAELLADGLSMPLLVNDVPTVEGLVAAGLSPQDASQYCIIGCNELGVPGRCMRSALAWGGTVQYIGLLTEVLLQPDGQRLPQDMGELLTALERRMEARLRASRTRGRQWLQRLAREVPTPFTSALMDGCIERGQDLLVAMKYQPVGIYERGLANAVNALAAIEQLVVRRREITLDELVAAMREDFAGGRLRAAIFRAPKWGNDDERADRWARVLVDMRERVLAALDHELGDPTHVVCHVVRSLHHLDGKRIPASPDGRRAWTPVADSIGAAPGTARGGPTATLRSVLKLDAARYYRGGYNLNLTLPAGVSARVVQSLVRGFFKAGGQELQIASLDPDVLRAAQAEPERYGDLVVRFAGLSARFVDLSREEQNELIERAEAACGVSGRRPPRPARPSDIAQSAPP